MNRSSLVVVMLALAATPVVVVAQGVESAAVGKLTPPAGWTVDQGRSAGLEKTVGMDDHFGGVPVLVSAQHLRAATPGGILVTSEVATEAIPSDANGAATLELHAARGGVDAMGAAAKVVRWDVKPDAGGHVAEARLEWHDASLGTTAISRTLVFRTKDALVRLAAECIIADDAAALRGPCEQALASLEPLTPVADRVALQVAATPVVAAPAVDVAAVPVVPSGPPADTLRPYEGEIPTTLIVTSPKKQTDRRPLYLLAGALVIGLVFWWNKREKARLRAEDAAARPSPPSVAKADDDHKDEA